MQIVLNLKKTLEKSADENFSRAKKLRKKAAGARKIVEEYEKKLARLEKQREKEIERLAKETEEMESRKRTAPKEWYEKYRWFISSDGNLCIGGRDASSNEVVVKKHTDRDDIIFHTEMAGSPFFVIKTEGKEVSELALQECANATAIFSRAWKIGLSGVEAFYVKPEQVSKTAQAGEYMSKGSFMVRGKRNIMKANMEAAVGKLKDGRLMCGPETAVRKHCKEFVVLRQGRGKASDCAKKIAKELHAHVDDVLPLLPAGGCKV